MILASDLADSPTSQGNRDMDSDPADNNNDRVPFPLANLPTEIRDLVYRHSLSNAFPKQILPRWVQGMQRVRGIATETLDAKSFTNLQLANRECHEEASLILYRECQFQFDIAPTHATFLDACWLSGNIDWGGMQDKKIDYMGRIENVVLKANWDGHDGAGIRNFRWANWTEATSVICRELQEGFPGLRRVTLDWRVPHPCVSLQPSRRQWLAISSYFETLQKERPDIEMGVLAWQYVRGTVPLKYRENRTSLEDYDKELADAETLTITPLSLSCVVSNN